MDRLAVDIVLIPPDDIMSKSIELNRRLIRTNPPKIELNPQNCIPHISLSMGVIVNKEIETFVEELNVVAGKYKPLRLRAGGIYSVEIPTGETVSGIALEISGELYAMHEDVMKLSDRYFTNDATADDVYSPPPVEEITLGLINSYPENSAFENFKPHITLGVGEMMNDDYREDFTASKLALFHLGNYCTCRKMIHHFSL